MKRLLLFYITWIVAHYIASHIYIYACVPNSIYGFLWSPFLVSTPYCEAIRWIIYTGGNHIRMMWICLGIWILAKIKIYE